MKKIIAFLIVVFALVSCRGNKNSGVETETLATSSIINEINQKEQEKKNARRIDLYDMNGEKATWATAYKGEFDGHTWYVFYDNLAVPAVVHDPLCKCGK